MDLCSFCSSLDLRYAGYYHPNRHGPVPSDIENDPSGSEMQDNNKNEGNDEDIGNTSNGNGVSDARLANSGDENDDIGEKELANNRNQYDNGARSEKDSEANEEYGDDDEPWYRKTSVEEMLERANSCRFCAAIASAFQRWLAITWKGRENGIILTGGLVRVEPKGSYGPYRLDCQSTDDLDESRFTFANVTVLIRDPDNPKSDNLAHWVGFNRPFQRARPDPPCISELLDATAITDNNDARGSPDCDELLSVWRTLEPYYGRRRLENVDMRLLRRWKETCDACHGDACRCLHIDDNGDGGTVQKGAKYRPKMIRLIDVDRMCLIETNDDSVTWATLSYVWGVKEFTTLTSHNLEDFKKPGALSGSDILPSTIADAIVLTRGLGERYLWADSLCIIQDSDADKAAFIPAMDAIYGLASVTIVALAGHSAYDGLPGVQMARAPQPLPLDINGVWLLPAPAPTATGFTNPQAERLGQYLKRGWTFQEAVLSRRFVVVTTEVVFWECRCATWREDANWEVVAPAEGDREGRAAAAVFRNSFFSVDSAFDYVDLWARGRAAFDVSYQNLVFDYSRRALTYDRDGLAAFAGVLSAIARTSGGEDKISFTWALPRPYLGVALTWPAEYNGENVDEDAATRPRGRFCRRTAPCPVDRGDGMMMSVPFPSWSWVGWVGPLLFQELFGTLRSEHAGLRFYMFASAGADDDNPGRRDASKPVLEEVPQNMHFEPKYAPAAHHQRAEPLWRGSSTEITAEMVPAALRLDEHIRPAMLAFWSSCATLRFTYDPQTWHGKELVKSVVLYQDYQNDSSAGSSKPYSLSMTMWIQRPDRWKAGDYEREFVIVGRDNLENIRRHSELIAIVLKTHASGARSRVAAINVRESEWNGIPHRRWEPVYLI